MTSNAKVKATPIDFSIYENIPWAPHQPPQDLYESSRPGTSSTIDSYAPDPPKDLSGRKPKNKPSSSQKSNTFSALTLKPLMDFSGTYTRRAKQPAIQEAPGPKIVGSLPVEDVWVEPGTADHLPHAERRNNKIVFYHDLQSAVPSQRSTVQSLRLGGAYTVKTNPSSDGSEISDPNGPFQQEHHKKGLIEQKARWEHAHTLLSGYQPFGDVYTTEDPIPRAAVPSLLARYVGSENGEIGLRGIDGADLDALWATPDKYADFVTSLGNYTETMWHDGNRFRTSSPAWADERLTDSLDYHFLFIDTRFPLTRGVYVVDHDGNPVEFWGKILNEKSYKLTGAAQLALYRLRAGDHINFGRIAGSAPHLTSDLFKHVRDGFLFSYTGAASALHVLVGEIMRKHAGTPIYDPEYLKFGAAAVAQFLKYHPGIEEDATSSSFASKVKGFLLDPLRTGKYGTATHPEGLLEELGYLMAGPNPGNNVRNLEEQALRVAMVIGGALAFCKDAEKNAKDAEKKLKLVSAIAFAGIKFGVNLIPKVGGAVQNLAGVAEKEADSLIESAMKLTDPKEKLLLFFKTHVLGPANKGEQVPGLKYEDLSSPGPNMAEIDKTRKNWGRYFAVMVATHLEAIVGPDERLKSDPLPTVAYVSDPSLD